MISIDLGSNTIRFLEFDCETKEKKSSFDKVVKTGDGLIKTGKIDDKAIERVVKAIEEAKERIDFNQPIKAITTEAIRQASNQKEVIDTIEKVTGVRFEVIDGELEAFYTAKAVEGCLKKYIDYNGDFLLLDIGGASTELSFKVRGGVISESYQIGILTITQKYLDLKSIEYGLKQELKVVKDFVTMGFNRFKKPDYFVASSGTPTTIAALKKGLNYETYDPEVVNGVSISVEDLDYWLDRLIKMEKREREKAVGVGRVDLIMTGILIFKEIFNITDYSKCYVCDDGLREGLALSECEK